MYSLVQKGLISTLHLWSVCFGGYTVHRQRSEGISGILI